MERRTFLQASAGFVAWLNFGKLAFGAATPKRLSRPDLLAQVYTEMVGCVGESTNPPVTQAFLNSLRSCVDMRWWPSKNDLDWIEPVKHSYSTGDKVKIVYRGTMPEFEAVSKIHPSLIGSTNEADLMRRMYLLNPDRTVHGGILDFIARINYSQYSAAIGDKDTLWLLTNEISLHVVDLRQTLGQIFFFPVSHIFRDAIDKCKVVKPYIPSDSIIIEMPDKHVWRLQYAQEDVPNSDNFEWFIRKFRVTKTKFVEWGSTTIHPIYGDK